MSVRVDLLAVFHAFCFFMGIDTEWGRNGILAVISPLTTSLY